MVTPYNIYLPMSKHWQLNEMPQMKVSAQKLFSKIVCKIKTILSFYIIGYCSWSSVPNAQQIECNVARHISHDVPWFVSSHVICNGQDPWYMGSMVQHPPCAYFYPRVVLSTSIITVPEVMAPNIGLRLLAVPSLGLPSASPTPSLLYGYPSYTWYQCCCPV